MKKIIGSFIIITVAAFVANARFIDSKPIRDLERSTDVIAVAKPLSTTVTDERTNLPYFNRPAIVGLSSKFRVIFILKGDANLKTLIVHHYRPTETNQAMLFDGPTFISLDTTNSPRYLLFLKQESDGRYAPFDQVDPGVTSMLKLSEAAWDKMNFDDFKKWMDAQRWLYEQGKQPNLNSWDISPVITADGRGDESLHEAALNGKLEKAKALIKANPELVNSQASYGQVTPLHLAAEYGHKDIAQLLLDNKADIEAKAYGNLTPLDDAILGGHKDLVELLIANHADVNVKNNWGETPLHMAAENERPDIAALLLANKADVRVKNNDGLTPLHFAASLGWTNTAKLFLANNADVNAKDNKGRTPLSLAMFHTNKVMMELLRQHGGIE